MQMVLVLAQLDARDADGIEAERARRACRSASRSAGEAAEGSAPCGVVVRVGNSHAIGARIAAAGAGARARGSV